MLGGKKMVGWGLVASFVFLLVVGIQGQEHGHSHGHIEDHTDCSLRWEVEKKVEEMVGKEYVVYVYALVATGIVGCLPVLILSFLPPLNGNPKLMNVLLAFAVGGLLGDVFLHLIPHAMDPHHHHEQEDHHHHHEHHDHQHDHHEHDHSHSNAVGLWVLAGLVTFLMIEKFVKILHGGEGHSHGHSHGKKNAENEKEKEKEMKQEGLRVAAYLNLAADFCHNVTDGLAIGASFKASLNLGLLTTFAVLLHELPHEIGDYAILVQSGFSKKQAMVAQLYTAIGAMAGTIFGLLAEGHADSPWILPFTAGGFVYIATTSVLPALLEKESLDVKQSIFEFLAIVLGIVLMLIVGLFE